MNTQTHMAIGLLISGKRAPLSAVFGALVGGLFPDFSIMVMVVIMGFILGTPSSTLWGETYYMSPWTDFDMWTNSLVVFGVMLVAMIFVQRRWPAWWSKFLLAFAGAAFAHAFFDLLTHATDGHAHLWPLTEWKFASPVSYYEPEYFGIPFAITEIIVGLLMGAYIFRFYTSIWARVFGVIMMVISLAFSVLAVLFLTGVLNFGPG